jgi:hypothetical protein
MSMRFALLSTSISHQHTPLSTKVASNASELDEVMHLQLMLQESEFALHWSLQQLVREGELCGRLQHASADSVSVHCPLVACEHQRLPIRCTPRPLLQLVKVGHLCWRLATSQCSHDVSQHRPGCYLLGDTMQPHTPDSSLVYSDWEYVSRDVPAWQATLCYAHML